MKSKLMAAAVFIMTSLPLAACQAIDPSMMGFASAPEEENVDAMDCAQLTAQDSKLRSALNRIEAAARITGTDIYEVRSQYNDLRRKVADAQTLAGCG
ncbi:hypothetical protein K1X12_14575 [Hyphomonas sp. WL0036]|uniref:hypothetical protein n=1 Tax=Hyphomonas sediminis TaxID=2866160 RepID=UPI001C817F16|nr:hypothetical protein [Hyphomonas sediminis]MBY9068133.1 hypothetical protein [Hyphomonas sediminis]